MSVPVISRLIFEILFELWVLVKLVADALDALGSAGVYPLRASTPPMTSMISPVICDWRARL